MRFIFFTKKNYILKVVLTIFETKNAGSQLTGSQPNQISTYYKKTFYNRI